MAKLSIAIGRRFGKLIIIDEVDGYVFPDGQKARRFRCRCDCGAITTPLLRCLIRGETTSCGCAHRGRTIARNTTHGLTHHPLNSIWRGMKKRCTNGKCRQYRYYGGRGISICDDWMRSFQSFYKWAITHGYERGLQIERKDNNGNYSPDNCEWTTRFVQMNNTRKNRFIQYQGRVFTIAQLARHIGLSYGTVWNRVKRNWKIEYVVSRPLAVRKYDASRIMSLEQSVDLQK